MEIYVEIPELPILIARLSRIPDGVRKAFPDAIKRALISGRKVAAQAAQARYNISSAWIKQGLGQPQVFGLAGYLRSSGEKAPLSIFPHADVFPGGVEVSELKGHTMTIQHAFIRGGKVLERMGKGAPRYPIKQMVGLAAPQMLGEPTQVFPVIETAIREMLMQRLEHNISALLSGAY